MPGAKRQWNSELDQLAVLLSEETHFKHLSPIRLVIEGSQRVKLASRTQKAEHF
jgi:hypothetical protein